MPRSNSVPPAKDYSEAIRRCQRAFLWTAGYNAISVPFSFFGYIIYSYLPPFTYFLLPVIFFILEIFTILFSIYVSIRYFFTPRFRAFYPLLLVILTYEAYWQLNPTKIKLNTFCSFFREEKEQMVHNFCTGKLHLDRKHRDNCYAMPKNLSHLTLSNFSVEIHCDNNREEASFILFGMLSNSVEMVYRSDDSPPNNPNNEYTSIERIEKKWFLTTQ